MSDIQKTDLAHCPFCGCLAWLESHASIFNDGSGVGHRIECRGECHAMTCYYHERSEAIKAWNTRAENKPQTDKRVLTYGEREVYACDVCGNVPDEDGCIEHGKGCYTQSEDGGGFSCVDFEDRAEDKDNETNTDRTN